MDNLEVAERVRNLITEVSPASVNITIPHIIAAIPVFLEDWGYKMTDNPSFVTYFDSKVFIPFLTNGRTSINNLVDGVNSKVRIDKLRSSTVYLEQQSGTLLSFKWATSLSELFSTTYPKPRPLIYFEGDTVFVMPVSGIITDYDGSSATIYTYLPKIPLNVTQIPPALSNKFVSDFAMYIRMFMSVPQQIPQVER